MTLRTAGLLVSAVVILGRAGPAEACQEQREIQLVWPTATSTAISAQTRILVFSQFNSGRVAALRLRVRSLTSTASANIQVTRLDSKIINTAIPSYGSAALWRADTDLTDFDGEVEVSAELVTEGDRVETSTSARVVVVPTTPQPAALSVTDNGAFFFRDGTFDDPFDSCSDVHANEGTLIYLHVQSELPASLTVIPTYPCASAVRDPAYALPAHGESDLVFSFFSHDCGQPTFRYELVDVLGRELSGPLNDIAACAPTLVASRWSRAEWQADGQPCTEELFDAGVQDSGAADAGTQSPDAAASDASDSPDKQEGCTCMNTAASQPAPRWLWLALLVPMGLRRRRPA